MFTEKRFRHQSSVLIDEALKQLCGKKENQMQTAFCLQTSSSPPFRYYLGTTSELTYLHPIGTLQPYAVPEGMLSIPSHRRLSAFLGSLQHRHSADAWAGPCWSSRGTGWSRSDNRKAGAGCRAASGTYTSPCTTTSMHGQHARSLQRAPR